MHTATAVAPPIAAETATTTELPPPDPPLAPEADSCPDSTDGGSGT